MTKACLAILQTVYEDGGDVTCGSFARSHYKRNDTGRMGMVAGAALAKVAAQGYLRRWAEYVGSVAAIHYRLTDKGRRALDDAPLQKVRP